jgi:hypothetical protein
MDDDVLRCLAEPCRRPTPGGETTPFALETSMSPTQPHRFITASEIEVEELAWGSRPLGPGESAHIPRNIVHGTYNAGDETLVFLAILPPAIFDGPAAGVD